MLKAVLLDLDGTLLDTLGDIVYYVNEALAAFSFPPVTPEQTARFIGDGAWELMERAVPHGAKELNACYEYFREHFARNTQEHTRLYDGELEKFFPEGLFDFVGGDTGSFPCKPDPSLAQYAALTLRVAPSECAFVGDGETDARVALRAGMFGVSVLWGYRSKEQLSAAGATRFASSYEELFRLLTT